MDKTVDRCLKYNIPVLKLAMNFDYKKLFIKKKKKGLQFCAINRYLNTHGSVYITHGIISSYISSIEFLFYKSDLLYNVMTQCNKNIIKQKTIVSTNQVH